MIHSKYNVLGALFLLFLGGHVYADSFFRAFEGSQAPAKGKQVLVPEHYRIHTVDQELLHNFLSDLPANPEKAVIITLPLPDGKSRDFYIWKTSMMEEPLQSRYRQVQTFTAVAKDDKRVTAKLDYTIRGFHAMIFDGNNTSLIDPYSDIADGYYTVYYKRDYKRPLDQMMTCELNDQSRLPDASGHFPEHIDGRLPDIGLKQHGSTQKTFRLALACTGEYAEAVGGTIPTTASVLSAMVTSMNRVNGIYERELGVTMTLIGNNDTLVYLDPATDPFTANNNGNLLLSQNQSNTGSVIGTDHYDIGHIFSTGGGGVAGLGVVCMDDFDAKARGVTGSANPVGDPYDIDYVAHEMGHQFAGDHSFNKCSNTEYEFTAYEPGSGSTIMAYAGICGPINNIQSNSDAYFHTISLDEISDFLVNGATCGTSAIGITPPVMAAINNTYNIPYQTPFELEAPVAAVAVTDTVTYCWEQWDLGDFQQDEDGAADFTEGPSFRSFLPSQNRLRIFPQIDSLLKNVTDYRGERLPAVARDLHFKVTSRNIYNGFGAFNISDDAVTLHVINTGNPFKVTAPNLATDVAYALAPKIISWDVSQTDIAPVSTAKVDIFLSVDGGYTYPFTLATGVTNNGAASVIMPDTSSTRARVKVKGAGNVFFDISDANFKLIDTVVLSIVDVQLNNDLLIYPNPASSQLHISNKGQGTLNLVLYNAVGQKIWFGTMRKDIDITVSGYAKGFYYLQVNDDKLGGKAVKRITLQ